jgi:adenosine deaminase
MPKVELHCHFEGSVPLSVVRELAMKHDVALPPDETGGLYTYIPSRDAFLEEIRDLPPWVSRAFARKYQRSVLTTEQLYELAIYEAFLDRFDTVCECLVDADDFSKAAYASLVEASDTANVRYREMLFHPMNHPGVSYQTMLAGLTDGIRAAETDRGIICRLIPSITRDHSVRAANSLLDEILAHRTPAVVGLASDYDEEHLPAYREIYQRAAGVGLPGTAHAGEYGSADTVRDCIELLGLRRVDHGYNVTRDPGLMRRAQDLGVHFACVFSYSVAIHMAEHFPIADRSLHPALKLRTPIADMLDAGLSVSLGSDDPVFQGFADLATEYVAAAGSLELDEATCVDFNLQALDAAWLDEQGKATLRRSIVGETEQIRDDLELSQT